MKILLTYGNNPLSWIIRKLTKEDGSHIAVAWQGWVLHSNLKGVQWQREEDFEAHGKVIDHIELPDDPVKLLHFSAAYVDHGKYDFGGLLYCAIRLCLRGVGIRLPKKNLWSMTGMFMCTELVSSFVYGEEDSMATPRQLFDQISGK